MDVDPQFRQARAASQRRKLRRRLQLALGVLGVLAVVGCVAALAGWLMSGDTAEVAAVPPDDDQIVQMEPEPTQSTIRVVTPFVDIPGDPMILRFAAGDGAAAQSRAGSASLDRARFGFPAPDQFALITEDLVVQESRLMTALPSSREDFAFFQAQRRQSLDLQPGLPGIVGGRNVATGQTEGELVTVADDSSWGAALGGEATATSVSYVETRIENTTSVAFVRPEAARHSVSQDLVVRLERDRAIDELLTDNGFDAALATELTTALPELMPQVSVISSADGLQAGTILALRFRPDGGQQTLLQMSVYGGDGYIGTLARRGTSGFIVAADPWLDEDLHRLAAPVDQNLGQQQDYRLLDAVYSALIRNGVPTTLVGELIVLLSQSYDLEAFAAPGDQVTLLYAPKGQAGPGQVAFAGITGPSRSMPCFVAPNVTGNAVEYVCFTPEGQRGGGGGGAFVTPVQGTMSSGFGPRFHPILKEVRLHAGVDWAAPTGTPVVAARSGRVAVAGNGGSYGNVVYLDHDGGLQSRYAHLDHFAPDLTQGQQVTAGEVIGFVGTTGRSTGPHLHFEMYQGGQPIDPFSLGGGGVLTASDAVEALTDRIIRVESAGNANARNALSTATGLGQFIESTWLRMMRDYRPDLSATMSRDDLLALRTDPTLSREMVQNLARENEIFLRSQGHDVDAGRLYLAHFLGPAGASTVLGAPDDQTVLVVMGDAVVRANPFLTNYTVADLKAWAQRKMRGAGSGGPRRAPLTPEVRAYIAAINIVLSEDA